MKDASKDNRSVPMAVRFPAGVKEALSDHATKNFRSMNATVVMAVVKLLESEGVAIDAEWSE